MIEFAGHYLTEDSVTANWPPTEQRVNVAFGAMGRLMAVYTPLLESIKAASDSVAGCPGTVYLLKQLYDGLRCGGTISGTLGSTECCRKMAFSDFDRRIHLVSIGEDCGTVEMTLQMAARLPEVTQGVQDAAWQLAEATIDEECAFFMLAMGLYFSAGMPPIAAFEKMLPYFSSEGTIKASILRVIEMLGMGHSVSHGIQHAQIVPDEIASQITAGEARGQLETTLIQFANLSVWPV